MATLKTDYQDDVLDVSENTNRVFNIVDQNGNIIEADVSLIEKTVLSQQGDNFGAQDINDTNKEINQINVDLTASNNVKFRFGTDGNGNYGYWIEESGVDVFHPFKTAHTETITITTNGTTDMGETHNNRYVKTNVPASAHSINSYSPAYTLNYRKGHPQYRDQEGGADITPQTPYWQNGQLVIPVYIRYGGYEFWNNNYWEATFYIVVSFN